MSEKFFEKKKPAAVLKHELLKRYLHMFVSKTKGRSTNGRVTYLDCYAGPGVYEDGSKGSPAVAIETAEIVRGDPDKDHCIDGIFIEQDPASVKALRSFLEDADLDWQVHHGTVETHLENVLNGLDPGTSLFVLLDPFGLGIPLDLLAKILPRSGPVRWGYRVEGAPTEVLLNFSMPGLRRNAGHLTSTSTNEKYLKARATILDRMDATLGGDWWRPIWESGAEDADAQILKGYLKVLGDLPGNWHWYNAPVSARWDGPARYSLVQLTQHPDGQWLFNEAVSNAVEEFRRTCFEEAGQLDLEPMEDRWAEWEAEIERNIEGLLAKGKQFTVQGEMGAIYGRTLGFARERHIRKAVKALYKAGKTSTDGKGKIQTMMIRPPKS